MKRWLAKIVHNIIKTITGTCPHEIPGTMAWYYRCQFCYHEPQHQEQQQP